MSTQSFAPVHSLSSVSRRTLALIAAAVAAIAVVAVVLVLNAGTTAQSTKPISLNGTPTTSITPAGANMATSTETLYYRHSFAPAGVEPTQNAGAVLSPTPFGGHR